MTAHYRIHHALPEARVINGKRPHPDLDHDHPFTSDWSCKRPRRVSTPSSAISAVTEEGDAPAPALPVVDNFDIPSPTYSLPSPTPFDPDQFSEQLTIGVSPTYSPPSHPSPPAYNLRPEEDIVADVDNSFATGQTGSVTWTNDMLIQVLANDIEDLCYTNEETGAPGVTDEFHNFFSQYKQPFELDFYIRRLVQYSNCSTAAFVIMLVYLDRVQERCKALMITEMNCHRLLCTALVLAIKYLDDEVFSNAYYARVGGVTCEEMNDLELKMLSVLGWDLNVSPETFALYEDGLIQSAGLLVGQGMPGSPVSPE